MAYKTRVALAAEIKDLQKQIRSEKRSSLEAQEMNVWWEQRAEEARNSAMKASNYPDDYLLTSGQVKKLQGAINTSAKKLVSIQGE